MVIWTRDSCESMVETRASLATEDKIQRSAPALRAGTVSHPSPRNPEVPLEPLTNQSRSTVNAPQTVVPSAPPAEADAKPFFIMDWLEQVSEQDLELAQKLLQTPSTSKKATSATDAMLVSPASSPPAAHHAKIPSYATPPRGRSTPRSPDNCFRRRSIAIGNGWNAKGLEKAKRGMWKEALACWENALEIRTQVLGEAHLDVANTCNNMGIAYGKLHRIDAAIASLNRALTIRTEHFGLQSSEVAATLHNMGNVLQQSGNLEAAMECFCETKRLQEQILGPNHVQVARACVAMGHTYYQASEYDDAHEAYSDALSIFLRAGLDQTNDEVLNVLVDIKELDKLLNRQHQ